MHTLDLRPMDTSDEVTVPEVGIINSLVHTTHAKPNTDTVNSFVRLKLFPSDGGEPDVTASRVNTREYSMAHWRSGRTEALQCVRTVRHEYFMSLSMIPCLTPTLSLLLEKVSCFSSAWITTNSKIPLCLHILWVFLEKFSNFPQSPLSWSSFNKSNSR